jgi:ferredoxin--NADP+ reductase
MTRLGSEQNPLIVAIVGSGPSGFYSTEALFKSPHSVKINMFERLPTPYGLVRSGVAPDHPKLKQATQIYARIAENPSFSFFGNVTVGRDITVAELRQTHHAVIFTTGAETDRRLHIPGEDMPGSHTAIEFVGWYNGHPDYRERTFDLSHPIAVIVGQGNIAADVARILSKTPDELRQTDIATHALDVLAESRIREIHIIGRRGPAQAKFTPKELKEFSKLDNCTPVVYPRELVLNPDSKIELTDKNNAVNSNIYNIFSNFTDCKQGTKLRRCFFTFLKSPLEICGNGHVEKIVLEKNRLCGEPFRQLARGTGETLELETGIVFRSIGYQGIAIYGVPFDEQHGIFPNIDGRIINDNKTVTGLYTAGWIKRGANGVIGTNRADSVATVASVLLDIDKLDTGELMSGAEGACTILKRRRIRHISFSDWTKIDQSEIQRGLPGGKPREKYAYVKEMMDLVDN